MKARHLFVDEPGIISFACALGWDRRIGIDPDDGTIAIDAMFMFLSRPMAKELAKVLSHYARTGELPVIEKKERPE